MPDAKTVFEKVKQLSPSVTDDVMPFCETAAAVLNGRIRQGVDASDIRLLTAAAAVALCDYIVFHNLSDGEVNYFKAGDITVKKGSGKLPGSAVIFRDMALAEAASLICDNDFDFRTV